MKRRDFLKLSAAVMAPAILIPRSARAATAASGSVDHLLILYAKGGLRSHAMFNAVGSFGHNPWGSQTAAAGTEWKLGAACGSNDITTSSGVVPAFAKISNEVAVLVPGLPETRKRHGVVVLDLERQLVEFRRDRGLMLRACGRGAGEGERDDRFRSRRTGLVVRDQRALQPPVRSRRIARVFDQHAGRVQRQVRT